MLFYAFIKKNFYLILPLFNLQTIYVKQDMSLFIRFTYKKFGFHLFLDLPKIKPKNIYYSKTKFQYIKILRKIKRLIYLLKINTCKVFFKNLLEHHYIDNIRLLTHIVYTFELTSL